MKQQLDTAAPLIARALLSLIFLVAGIGKILDWDGSAAYMASKGLILIPLLLGIAIAFELAGGLCLLAGLKTRQVALALALYLVPVTLVFHAFWTYEGMERQIQMANFLKNLAIAGGLVQVFAYGAGRVSIDDRLKPRLLRKKVTAVPLGPKEPAEA
ncbi:MAG: DoxX family protein [Deltaproteobacteria bacterium]|nr:DoxX family protein [Deltaproteobacteria bacterium]